MANRKQTPLMIRTKQKLMETEQELEAAKASIRDLAERNKILVESMDINNKLEKQALSKRDKLIDELKYSLNSLAEQNSAIWKEYREFKQLVSLAMDNLINKERSRNLSNSVNLQYE